MDAVEYVKARRDMCNKFWLPNHTCKNCPLSMDKNGHNQPCALFTSMYPEETVAIVEKWAKENNK